MPDKAPEAVRIAVLDDFQNIVCESADWARVGERAKIDFYADHAVGEALVARLAPYDAIVLIRERTPAPRTLIEVLPNLKAIFTMGMRNNAIDLTAASEHGVLVCGTDSASLGTAELALGFLIALARRIVSEERSLRAGAWQSVAGVTLAGKTLGIVGLGKLGRQLAGYGKMLGMDVIAWSQNLTEEAAGEVGVRRVDKMTLFSQADFISLHLILSERSRGVVDREAIRAMKPSAYIVNTARSGLVDMPALIDALQARQVAGAALDVFDTEPMPAGAPLLSAPNTLLTPHLGYATQDAFAIYCPQVLEAILAWLDGAPIRRLS